MTHIREMNPQLHCSLLSPLSNLLLLVRWLSNAIRKDTSFDLSTALSIATCLSLIRLIIWLMQKDFCSSEYHIYIDREGRRKLSLESGRQSSSEGFPADFLFDLLKK